MGLTAGMGRLHRESLDMPVSFSTEELNALNRILFLHSSRIGAMVAGAPATSQQVLMLDCVVSTMQRAVSGVPGGLTDTEKLYARSAKAKIDEALS